MNSRKRGCIGSRFRRWFYRAPGLALPTPLIREEWGGPDEPYSLGFTSLDNLLLPGDLRLRENPLSGPLPVLPELAVS